MALPQTGIFALGTNMTRRSVGARCLDHSGSFAGATACREEALRVRTVGRAIPIIVVGALMRVPR
jgi:hypothetical protein